MEEMEQERKNREREEKERAERMKKIKEDFNDPNSQWDKDKADIEGITQKDEEVKKQREREKEIERKQGAAGQTNKEPNAKADFKGVEKDSDTVSKREASEPNGAGAATVEKEERKNPTRKKTQDAKGAEEEPKAAKPKAALE